jgi:hypothetical protein
MHALVLLLAASISPEAYDPPTGAHTAEIAAASACAAQRLTPFLSPYGIRQAWPVMASPPPELLHAMGTPISDMGHIADGYQHFLHVDAAARAVYVIEQGGFAGTTKVYGPLPLPRCTPTAEAPPR